jgi:hypothetical protein
MTFLCLGYLDVEAFDRVPEEEKRAILDACAAQCVPFRETGRITAEEGLEGPSSARTIRPRRGRPMVTDGPFAETREQIGSYFVVEAADIDEAVAVASLHPAARMGEEYGFGIEVRPVQRL